MRQIGIIIGTIPVFLVLTPNAILIARNNPFDIIPVLFMTLFLISIMGLITGKINEKQYNYN